MSDLTGNRHAVLRNSHTNGFKQCCIESRLGSINLKMPQVCNSDLPVYSNALERGERRLEVISTPVSRATAELDPMLEAWRNRPISPIAHLILDARDEKACVAGIVRSFAVFKAIGIRWNDRKRIILENPVSLSEAEVHSHHFLSSLKFRGLFPTASITSDAAIRVRRSVSTEGY